MKVIVKFELDVEMPKITEGDTCDLVIKKVASEIVSDMKRTSFYRYPWSDGLVVNSGNCKSIFFMEENNG